MTKTKMKLLIKLFTKGLTIKELEKLEKLNNKK